MTYLNKFDSLEPSSVQGGGVPYHRRNAPTGDTFRECEGAFEVSLGALRMIYLLFSKPPNQMDQAPLFCN